MIALQAIFSCDRCYKTICAMENIDDEAEARSRVSGELDWGSEDEDGNDVCAECWRKWDAEHSSDSAQTTDAVDPVGGKGQG